MERIESNRKSPPANTRNYRLRRRGGKEEEPSGASDNLFGPKMFDCIYHLKVGVKGCKSRRTTAAVERHCSTDPLRPQAARAVVAESPLATSKVADGSGVEAGKK